MFSLPSLKALLNFLKCKEWESSSVYYNIIILVNIPDHANFFCLRIYILKAHLVNELLQLPMDLTF